MEQLPDKADEVVNLLLRNVLESDQVFREGEAAVTSGFNTRLLDLKQMENDLRNKDRMKILNTVKTVLGKLSREKSVSVETLLVIQQEILQLIYTNLYQNGIQAAELFGDEVSRKIQRQSVRSVFDMIKWVNYAISRTLEYEDEINRSLSLADKIESYVKEHYKEDISRDTIADVFFLTPEYLAKVYKRQTGHNLKDYIIGYRIEMAKQLLADDIKSISDISAEVRQGRNGARDHPRGNHGHCHCPEDGSRRAVQRRGFPEGSQRGRFQRIHLLAVRAGRCRRAGPLYEVRGLSLPGDLRILKGRHRAQLCSHLLCPVRCTDHR